MYQQMAEFLVHKSNSNLELAISAHLFGGIS